VRPPLFRGLNKGRYAAELDIGSVGSMVLGSHDGKYRRRTRFRLCFSTLGLFIAPASSAPQSSMKSDHGRRVDFIGANVLFIRVFALVKPMTRRPLHPKEDILDATRSLVLERGVHSATIDAISRCSGTPVGSLYHSFGSRDRLLAQMWVRGVRRSQAAFIAAARHPEPEQATVDAALSIYEFVRQHPADARLLASFRREDLLRDTRSPGLIRELEQLNQPLEAAVTVLARRLFGKPTRRAVAQTLLAAIDIPMGTVRRYLLAGSEIPEWLREPLEAAVRAILCKARGSS
jgi:AcrR family transcriptional regulator